MDLVLLTEQMEKTLPLIKGIRMGKVLEKEDYCSFPIMECQNHFSLFSYHSLWFHATKVSDGDFQLPLAFAVLLGFVTHLPFVLKHRNQRADSGPYR